MNTKSFEYLVSLWLRPKTSPNRLSNWTYPARPCDDCDRVVERRVEIINLSNLEDWQKKCLSCSRKIPKKSIK